jgi:bifunctional non-homologous end joining protein LigD
MQPMLATSGGQPTEAKLAELGATHLADIKWDGARAIASVTGGALRLTNRAQRDITARYPDLAKAADVFDRDVVLDGEIVVLEAGRPSFSAVHTREAQRREFSIRLAARQHPATFIAFDLLELDGQDLRGEPLTERLRLLAGVVSQATDPFRPSTWSDDPLALWRLVRAQGLEGLILKRRASRYVPRRSRDWLKFKATQRIHALAVGYEPGEGERADTVGALKLVLVRDTGAGHQLVEVGKVGSGFTRTELDRCKARLDAGEYFAVVVEVAAVTPAGHLRFPAYKGMADIAPAEASIDQLDALPVT